MHTQIIPLDQLCAHPANSNVMPEHLFNKLVDHIADKGHYPPLIVRPLPADDTEHATPRYQILDGHHRVKALARIGREAAACVVWDVDDDRALLLLATLNRLQGRDDPLKRSALIDQLSAQCDVPALTRWLPECAEQVRKLLSISRKPAAPRLPQPIADMPVAVHFFLMPEQKRRLLARLKEVGGNREQALMTLVDRRP